MDNTPKKDTDYIVEAEGDRAKVIAYSTQPRFMPGDRVFHQRPGTGSGEGPFIVSSVLSTGKYTLVGLDGQPARQGQEVDEGNLVAA